MHSRTLRFLKSRLRHEAWRRSIRVLVESEFIEEEDRFMDGYKIRVFHPRTAIPETRLRHFDRILTRLDPKPEISAKELDFDHRASENDDVFSGRWAEVDSGTNKLTGYRRGAESKRQPEVKAPTLPGLNPSSNSQGLTDRRVSMLARIRAARRLLSPSDAATVLLLVKAIENAGLGLADLKSVLSEPGLIATVCGGVEGFETSFMALLKRGIFGPPHVALLDGTRISKGGQFVVPKDTSSAKQIITFIGSEIDSRYAELTDWQLGRAAELGVTVLGVTEETALLPKRMLPASSLRLTAGPITSSMVRDIIAWVTGISVHRSLEDRQCAFLTLSDLSLAIRPGVDPVRAINLLKELARSRTDNDRTASSVPGRTPSFQQLVRGNRTQNTSSGSEIIQPADADASDPSERIPRVESLAGYGEAKTWAMNLKDDLALWKSDQLSWTKLSSKILLCGPPGTGKTLFAKALANSLNLPLFATSVGTWLEPSYLGDVLERMRAAFSEARTAVPCILFIDETDTIGSRRSGDGQGSDYWNSVVARLLELLDGVSKSTGVIVVGATNNADLIDPALLRSGRLEKQVVIPLPDIGALEKILQFHLGPELLDDDKLTVADQNTAVDRPSVVRLATMAAGLSGADVERLIREARQLARQQKRPLAYSDVETVIRKTKPKRDERLLRISAVHEAGHAIACLVLGGRSISTLTLNGHNGRAYLQGLHSTHDDGSEQSVHDDIIVCLSGRAAEELVLGRISRGSGGGIDSDLARATELASALETAHGFNAKESLVYLGSIEPFSLLAGRQDIALAVHQRLDACYDRAKALIGRNIKAVSELADALIRHESLDGQLLNEVLDRLDIS